MKQFFLAVAIVAFAAVDSAQAQQPRCSGPNCQQSQFYLPLVGPPFYHPAPPRHQGLYAQGARSVRVVRGPFGFTWIRAR